MDRDNALSPSDEGELAAILAEALAQRQPLELVGGGSKRAVGRPLPDLPRLALDRLRGVTLYEPEELVLSAGAGTPLAEISERLAEAGQCLAFEPPDWGPLLGAPPGAATLGGAIAANLSGPRRIKAGAARDHLLGLSAVSGRGETFKAGGRVVKNVSGYDVCKLIAGSWGTLAAVGAATVKTLPAPEAVRTALVYGLDDTRAIAALTAALQSPHDVSAAAHLPAEIAAASAVGYVRDAGKAVTAVRIEGHRPSVEARAAALSALLADWGATEELHRRNSETLWREVGDVAPFAGPLGEGRTVWRLSVPPARGAAVAGEIRNACDARAFYDWGGGLVWLAVADGADGAHETVRGALRDGGHALLVRAPEAVRARVPVFQPLPAPVAALTRRLKEAFDPANILNPGRMNGPDRGV